MTEFSEKRRAFLDLMLLSNKEGNSTLSDVDIRNEVDTFMFEVIKVVLFVNYSMWLIISGCGEFRDTIQLLLL